MNEINNEPLGAKCSWLNRGKVEISPWCDLLILYMPVGPSLHRNSITITRVYCYSISFHKEPSSFSAPYWPAQAAHQWKHSCSSQGSRWHLHDFNLTPGLFSIVCLKQQGNWAALCASGRSQAFNTEQDYTACKNWGGKWFLIGATMMP